MDINIIQALLAIPPAIAAIKDSLLRARGGPEVEGALEKLRQLKAYVEIFCNLHQWLREAKEYHDCLSTLDHSLERAFQETIKARAEGPFNPEVFNVPEARKAWDGANVYSLEKVLSFARDISYIEPHPLIINPTGAFQSGPPWAKKLLDLRAEIISAFRQYDCGNMNAKYDLSDAFDKMVSHVKSEIIRANQMIRKEAGVLADELHKLQGGVANV